MSDMNIQSKTVIGRTAYADFPTADIHHVPVKIDTGADSSSIWVSNLSMTESGVLKFSLFGEESPYYTGKLHEAKRYSARFVRSSNGTAQVRYSVKLSIILAGRRVRGTFTLADRSENTFPVLVGCKLLNGKFVVDVSKGKIRPEAAKERTHSLNEEMKKDPHAFFAKYHQRNQRGDLDL